VAPGDLKVDQDGPRSRAQTLAPGMDQHHNLTSRHRSRAILARHTAILATTPPLAERTPNGGLCQKDHSVLKIGHSIISA